MSSTTLRNLRRIAGRSRYYGRPDKSVDDEDMFHDALVKLLENDRAALLACCGDTPPSPSARRAVYRKFRNHTKDRGDRDRNRPTSLQFDENTTPVRGPENGPGELLESMELNNLILESLESLSHRQRQALQLHCIDGFSTEETARQLDVPVGTVRSDLYRGRAALRRKLEGWV